MLPNHSQMYQGARREKTEFTSNKSQQTKDSISRPCHVRKIRPEFLLLAANCTHDQFIAGLRFLMLLHFQEIIGKGHASNLKPGKHL